LPLPLALAGAWRRHGLSVVGAHLRRGARTVDQLPDPGAARGGRAGHPARPATRRDGHDAPHRRRLRRPHGGDGRRGGRHGGGDVLVNNAGIQNYGTVEEMPEEAWDRTIAVNLKSVYLVSKYVVPELRRRGGGAIVNVASVQGLATQPAVAAYAASKGGILA